MTNVLGLSHPWPLGPLIATSIKQSRALMIHTRLPCPHAPEKNPSATTFVSLDGGVYDNSEKLGGLEKRDEGGIT